MSSELKFVKTGGEDYGGGLLLHDIEEISHALYLHVNKRKAWNPTSDHHINVVPKYSFSESRNKFKIQDSPQKDKKLSIWNWKPLKALTHNRKHRFNCCFFLHVHAIEGLPSNFNSLNLCVTWSRKGKTLKTHPSRAYLGMAEFEETLMDLCTINCSRNRAHNSANYDPKVFLLHTSVIGATTLDIGKHWIDLTRLLPMTLEELESEEGGSGKWTTSFKLTGMAKGAMLNVSFGFFTMSSNSFESGNYGKVPNVENERGPTTANYIADFCNSHQTSQINYHSTIPTGSSKRSHCRSQSLELKFLDGNLPSRGSELAHSVSLLYQKIDQEKMCDVLEFDYGHESLQSLKPKAAPSLESASGNIGHEVDGTKFSIVERDLGSSMINQVKLEQHGSQRMDSSLIEIINVAEIFDWEETVFDENVECNPKLRSDDHDKIDDTKPKENSMSIKEPSDEELDLVFYDMMASRSADLDSSQDINNFYGKVPNVENERGPTTANYIADFGDSHQTSQINYHSTIPTGSSKRSHCRSQSLELKFIDDNLPSRGSELAHSVSLLYQKIDQEKMCDVLEFDYSHESLQSLKPKAAPSLESASGNIGHEVDGTKFSIVERDLDSSMIYQVKLERHGSQRMDSSLIEIINVAEIFDWKETVFNENIECNPKLGSDDHDKIVDTKPKENSMSIKEPSDEELNLVFYDMMASRSADLDSSQDINNCYEQETSERIQSCNKYSKFHESLSLDDVAESIENDFLNMLCRRQSTDDIGFNNYLESPRDQLLKQFEEDNLPWENDSLDTVVMAEQEFFCRTSNGYRRMPHADNFGLSPATLADEEYLGGITHSMSKKNSKVIENLETVALMQEWGLNEKDFQNSPCSSSGGFGSPVCVPPAEPLKLPSLQECLGPIIQIKGGGFLRSMNPLLFRNANNGARLIVQVSAPVVFPKAMGLTVMEILQCWASVGVEKMSIQADKLMPLEDITGKTVQQVVPEAESISEVFKSYRLDLEKIDSDCVSFENIVPVAITNFEGLLIEGLKIQSGLPDKESPSKVGIQFIGSSDPDKAIEVCANFGSQRTSGFRLLGDEELVKYSLSLEDWMRFDTEGFDTDGGAVENGLKLLGAHCTGSLELSSVRDYVTSNKNFIMGLKVQLRDPLRDNERVGSSMLAMIEVERIPSPNLPCTSGKILNDEKDGLDEKLVEEIVGSEQKSCIFEKGIPQFKFSEVHITGLNTSLGKELWGTDKQQQSGSRWLLSSGLGRTNKNHICKSKAIIQSSSRIMRMPWPADVLWSISSHTQGEAATWDEIVGLNVYKRNPDIIFP